MKELIEYKDLSLDVIRDTLSLDFKTIGETELQVIAEGMLGVRRNMEVYGRRNSQVTSKLMTLSMLKHGPYGAIKQCDAQINKKYNAVKENWFKLQKKKVKLDKLEHKLQNDKLDEFQVRYLEIDIFKIKTELHDVTVHIEHAYKEMYMYMDVKKEIMESNNIPEKFSEENFIEAEIRENLTTAFQHALRDIQVNNMSNHGTLEWMEQFGVNPAVAYAEARQYLNSISNTNIELIDVENLYKWYDEMYEKYKNEYKKSMKRLGIKNIMTDAVAYKEPE